MTTVTINGVTIEVDDNASVNIAGGNVIINGKVHETLTGLKGGVEVRILEGVLNHLTSDKSVTALSVKGNVTAGGSINCDNVGGNVTAGGSVNCDDIAGNAKAGGSINCDDIGGDATASIIKRG
jgi:hypothetical protein